MIINRLIDVTATITRLFVYKIVVLNNIFPSIWLCIQLLKKEKMEKISAFYFIGFFLLWKYTKKVCTII